MGKTDIATTIATVATKWVQSHAFCHDQRRFEDHRYAELVRLAEQFPVEVERMILGRWICQLMLEMMTVLKGPEVPEPLTQEHIRVPAYIEPWSQLMDKIHKQLPSDTMTIQTTERERAQGYLQHSLDSGRVTSDWVVDIMINEWLENVVEPTRVTQLLDERYRKIMDFAKGYEDSMISAALDRWVKEIEGGVHPITPLDHFLRWLTCENPVKAEHWDDEREAAKDWIAWGSARGYV